MGIEEMEWRWEDGGAGRWGGARKKLRAGKEISSRA